MEPTFSVACRRIRRASDQNVNMHTGNDEAGDADYFIHVHGESAHAFRYGCGETCARALGSEAGVVKRHVLMNRIGYAAADDVFLVEDGAGWRLQVFLRRYIFLLHQSAKLEIMRRDEHFGSGGRRRGGPDLHLRGNQLIKHEGSPGRDGQSEREHAD